MGFLSAFDNFGKSIKKGFTDFGVKAGKALAPKNVLAGLKSAGQFIERKALPVLQQVASGVATGAKYLAPALAFTPLAEFAPVVAGIGAGASLGAKALGSGRKALKVAGEAVDAVNRPSLEKTAKLGQKLSGLF
jgi:hypothetical protein